MREPQKFKCPISPLISGLFSIKERFSGSPLPTSEIDRMDRLRREANDEFDRGLDASRRGEQEEAKEHFTRARDARKSTYETLAIFIGR